jgi:hypothetical protein
MLTGGPEASTFDQARAKAIAAMVRRRVGGVLQKVNRFWAGEVEVAETFFRSPRSNEEHVHWLGYQMMKEYMWPDGRLTPLRKAYDQLESGVGRHEIHALFREAEEEFSHYVVLADIAEKILGRPLPPKETEKHRYGIENQALLKIRTSESDWDRATSHLHEGGGLGVYFAGKDLTPMSDDPYRTDIADAMTLIYNDELTHFGHGFSEFVHVAIDALEETWKQVTIKAELVGYHRVRMRNEQFGFPLSEERLQEIREGEIVPYIPPFPSIDQIVESLVTIV